MRIASGEKENRKGYASCAAYAPEGSAVVQIHVRQNKRSALTVSRVAVYNVIHRGENT